MELNIFLSKVGSYRSPSTAGHALQGAFLDYVLAFPSMPPGQLLSGHCSEEELLHAALS